MKTHQKAFVVISGPEGGGLDELNQALSRGWHVVHAVPMGGAGVGAERGTPALHFAALVIAERRDQREATLLEQVQEETEELIEELVEGDGAGLPIDPDADAPAGISNRRISNKE